MKRPLVLPLALTTLALVGAALYGLRRGSSLPVPPPSVAGLTHWQLLGWREHDGKREPWELSFQASPLFYRERLGSEEVAITDEGTILVYTPPGYRARPVVLLAPARPIRPTLPAYLERDGPQVDPKTGFPLQFRWQRQERQTRVALRATYNQPLSSEAHRPLRPVGARELNLLKNPGKSPPPGSTTKGIFTLLATAEEDPTGLVRVELHYWLAGVRVTRDFPLRVEASVLGIRQADLRPLSRPRESVQFFSPTAPHPELELPLRLSVAFRHPPSPRIAAHLYATADVNLRLRVRRRSQPFPDAPQQQRPSRQGRTIQ